MTEPMAQVVSHVHKTTDYGIFKTLEGNRSLNKLHRQRLLKSMQETPLISVAVVNRNYEVIDGQHRLSVCKELKLPFYYIIVENYGLNEVHRLNMNSKNWTVDDYMNAYADMGIPEYVTYRDFKNRYGFNHSVCITALCGGRQKEALDKFTSGGFIISDYNKAIKIANAAKSYIKLTDVAKRYSFLTALWVLAKRDNFNLDEFYHKLSLNPRALIELPRQSQYVELIEEIYNYKRRDKVNLRF